MRSTKQRRQSWSWITATRSELLVRFLLCRAGVHGVERSKQPTLRAGKARITPDRENRRFLLTFGNWVIVVVTRIVTDGLAADLLRSTHLRRGSESGIHSATIDQQILADEKSRIGAAQEGAGLTELFGGSEASGGNF